MLRASRFGAASLAAVILSLMFADAWAQTPQPTQQPTQPGGTQTRPGTTQEQLPPQEIRPPLIEPTPQSMSYPMEFLGLLAPPPGAATLVPSLSLTEEYIDNVFFSNTNREWDLVTSIIPAVSLYLNQPRYRLVAGISTSADLYARDSSLNQAFGRANLLLAGDYTATRDLTLRLADTLAVDRNTAATGTFSVGRQLSLTNLLTPGLRWQITPRSAIDAYATYGVRRFFGEGSGDNSDTYQLQANFDYGLTSRFTGTLGYGFTYLHTEGLDDSITHTPTIGFGYRVTPSLSVNVSGGPAVTIIAGDTFVTPAGNVSITQVFRAGTVNLQYIRGVSVAGGFGGTTDNQTAVATVVMPTWIRDLIFLFSPSWNKAESVDSQQASQVDVEAYRITLGLSYRLSRYASIFGGYDYIRQRTGKASTEQVNADQNRVRVGIQVGYPFSLD
jgi:hypothetical protein